MPEDTTSAPKAQRKSSLRQRSALVVLVLLVMPVLFASAFDSFDATGLQHVRLNTALTSIQLAELLQHIDELDGPPEEFERLANKRHIRLRIFTAQGYPLVDTLDGTEGIREEESILRHRTAIFALTHADGHACEVPRWSRVWHCLSVRYIRREDQSVRFIAVVQQVMPHTLRSPRMAVRAMSYLFFFSLAVALALAYWIWDQLIRPIQQLRSQVLSRVTRVPLTTPITVENNDEFGDLAASFNALLGALEARTKANQSFVADLAHELKNPVAAVRACAESMSKSDGLDRTRAQRIARILDDSGQRLDAIVTRFMELAQAEAGLAPDARVPVALHTLVEGVITTVKADERYKRLHFETSLTPLQVLGDAGQLETALRNVLQNAASFSPEEGTIEVRLQREEDSAVLTVRDHGPGIAPEHLPRLFDRFFTTRRSAKGTGLGLALTRAIIEAHEGRIAAQSTLGDGALFELRLPCKEA